MIIGSISEKDSFEKRVLLTPDTIKKFIQLGFEVNIENNFGSFLNIKDEDFKSIGAYCLKRNEILGSSDILLKINCPTFEEITLLKENTILIGNFFPHLNKEIINKLINKKVKIFSLELLPRITRAQSMDILSSQANIAGYKAVIDCVYEFNKVVPMMMTAAGTVTPAKFFIIGAGVAGLQAIATAKRLGGVVSATDVRLASKEQVESLGGKFVFVEADQNLETTGGYAKEVGEDYKKKQEELLKKTLALQDIVICTALMPGKRAPRIINEEMLGLMKRGSIICDLAVEQGGNCVYSESGKVVEKFGIKILGYKNVPSRISETASNLLSRNIYNFLSSFYDKQTKSLKIDENDEIIKSIYVKDVLN